MNRSTSRKTRKARAGLINFRFTPTVEKWLRDESKRTGKPMKWIIEDALRHNGASRR